MTEETKAGLKLLAEYMGVEINLNWTAEEWMNKYAVPLNLSYNTSWDALVPVYAKACSVTVKEGFYFKNTRPLVQKFEVATMVNNPQAAFEAVVELVKLINKEKE